MSYVTPSSRNRSRLSTRVRTGVAVIAACFVTSPVYSNPLNPTVVNGTATFNQAGSVLTVTNSTGAIINWDKFSIKTGETTHFAQTAASSTVLNRVLNDPTVIYGTLSSNGQVWLVNPAGIMVGPGGLINTAGFVASTLAIRNEDFLAGRHLFVNDGSAKNVINQGEIRTPDGGSVYLIGSNVTNEGIITTPGGETILAAGATVSLIDSATPGVKVDITGAEGNATNLGTITAEAGRIGIAGVIVRNSGTLNASSVVNEGGRIFLKASQDAYVDGNGRIVTTGTKGGSVEVLGNRVAIMDNAVIDASGTNGGGRIMIGGDYQGKNPEIQNASITYFGPNAKLKADATEVGDGGTVIVWADDTTRAYGSISARGGAMGGNGGFVETSGKRYLDAHGIRIDIGANNGTGGLWLLDPSAINIVPSGTSDTTFYGGVFSYGGTVGTLVDADINAALYGGSVTVQTDGAGGGTGDITATGVTITGGYSLSLLAYGDGGTTATGNIRVENSTISTNGLTMVAGWSGSGYSTATIADGAIGKLEIVNSSLTSSAGTLLKAAGNITIDSPSSVNASSNVEIMAGRDVAIDGTVRSTSFGDVIVTAGLGYFGYGSTANAYGGNITLGANSIIDAGNGYAVLQADRGTDTGANGNIIQYGGGTGYVWGFRGVSIAAGADAKIGGNVGSNGYVQIVAGVSGGYYGYANLSSNAYGGNVELGTSSIVQGYGGVLIRAERGTVVGDNGNITQYGGQIIAGPASCLEGCYGYGNVAIVAAGNVRLDGNVIAYGNSFGFGHIGIAAGAQINGFGFSGGYGYGYGSGSGSGYANEHGGNITLGSSSQLLAKGSVYLVAERGILAGAGGDITQYGGQIVAGNSGGNGDVTIIAGGNVRLDGSVTANDSGFGYGNIAIAAGRNADFFNNGYGYFSASGYASGYGGNISVSGSLSGHYGVQLIAESGYQTGLNGNITQSAGSITAGNGGVGVFATGDAAIGIINAPTGYVGIYAGGAIYDNNGTALNITADTINLGSQSGGVAGGLAISMDTSATSALYGYVAPGATFGGISIRNFGTSPSSVYLTDQASFQSSANFTQNGDLTVGYGGTAISMMADDLALLSTGNMTIGSSGLSLTAAAYGSILIGAAGSLLLDGADIFPAANVDVGLAAGGSMTLTNGAYVHGENLVAIAGQEVSLAYDSEIGAWQTALVAAGSGIRLEDSHIHSDFSDVLMVTGGDIRVNDGSSIYSGNSVYLSMNGGASTLYLNEFSGMSPSYIHALNPNTINIDFAARSSGGIVIDGVPTTTTSGSSGFFVGSSMIPATAGAGLNITYANALVVDPCVSNPDLCKPPSPTSTPIDPPPVTLLPLDPTQPLEYPGYTIGGTEDSFGGEEEAEKKSDEAKDEKKDEKSAHKKVAQCSS